MRRKSSSDAGAGAAIIFLFIASYLGAIVFAAVVITMFVLVLRQIKRPLFKVFKSFPIICGSLVAGALCSILILHNIGRYGLLDYEDPLPSMEKYNHVMDLYIAEYEKKDPHYEDLSKTGQTVLDVLTVSLTGAAKAEKATMNIIYPLVGRQPANAALRYYYAARYYVPIRDGYNPNEFHLSILDEVIGDLFLILSPVLLVLCGVLFYWKIFLVLCTIDAVRLLVFDRKWFAPFHLLSRERYNSTR